MSLRKKRKKKESKKFLSKKFASIEITHFQRPTSRVLHTRLTISFDIGHLAGIFCAGEKEKLNLTFIEHATLWKEDVKHFYFYQITTKNNVNSVSIECKNRRKWWNIECSKYMVIVLTRIFILRNKLQETENLLTKLISSSSSSSSSVININYHVLNIHDLAHLISSSSSSSSSVININYHVLNIHDPYGTNGSLKRHGQSFNEIHGSSTQPYDSWIY